MAGETIYLEEGPELFPTFGFPIPASTVYLEEGVAGDPFFPWPEPCPTLPSQDTTKPVVAFVSPIESAQIETGDALVFDVTDNSGQLGRVLVAVVIASTADQELAHDGIAFTARYTALSTRTAIVGGFRFSIRRTGGWPRGTTVTVRVWAVDPSGNLET